MKYFLCISFALVVLNIPLDAFAESAGSMPAVRPSPDAGTVRIPNRIIPLESARSEAPRSLFEVPGPSVFRAACVTPVGSCYVSFHGAPTQGLACSCKVNGTQISKGTVNTTITVVETTP